MAVAEFQGQYYKDTDLASFKQSCHRDVTVATNVGKNEESAGVESELDIEYIKSVAPEIPLTVVYNAQYSLLDWTHQITNLENSPLVHSVSYGNDEVQQSSTQYMYTCNTAFMKAGVKGLSILFASGDQGVCGRSGCGLLTHSRFHPDFPAASPYITAVGGTDFAVAGTIGDETTWKSGGGGFSDTFAQPDYQKEAVAAYLADSAANFPPQDLWNKTGRGYPDLAALGGQKNSYCVATGGRFAGVAGTSASCPVAAGIFAKVNGVRLAAGKPAMGFLNPFIYKNPSAFFDVTSGTNSGEKTYGFTAVKGWDAATGFGTPNYEALAKAAMAAVEKTVVV
jgi:tripeptidyl-peptidase-1